MLKMKKISMILVLLLIISLIIPTILAHNISVTIQTVPGNDVEFRVLDRVTGKILDPVNAVFYEKADETGKVYINYSAVDPIIKASLTLKRNNEIIKINESNMKVFDNLMAQGINYIDLRDLINPKLVFEKDEKNGTEEILEIAEETGEKEIEENNTKILGEESTKEIEAQQTKIITGSVISGAKSVIKSKVTYFVIVGLVVVFVLLLIVKNKFKSEGNLPKKTDNFRVVPLSEKRANISLSDQKIEEIEKKIQDAKSELDDLVNKRKRFKETEEKIKRDKEAFRRDKEELERLKGDNNYQ